MYSVVPKNVGTQNTQNSAKCANILILIYAFVINQCVPV